MPVRMIPFCRNGKSLVFIYWIAGIIYTSYTIHKDREYNIINTSFDLWFLSIYTEKCSPNMKFVSLSKNISRYFNHPSVITRRDGTRGEHFENNKTFPKILICSHSMHSRKKLEENFPNVRMEHLIKFYGTAKSKLQKEFWNKLVISNVSKVQGKCFYPTLI